MNEEKEDKGEGKTNLIGLRDLFEFRFSFFLVGGVLIRVPFHGQLSVSFLQIVICGVLVNLQKLVVIHTHIFLLFRQLLVFLKLNELLKFFKAIKIYNWVCSKTDALLLLRKVALEFEAKRNNMSKEPERCGSFQIESLLYYVVL